MKSMKMAFIPFIFLLVFTLLCNTIAFSISYDLGYKEGYANGVIDGTDMAEIDIKEGNRKSYRRAMLSEDEIIKLHGLENENEDYINSFLDGYEDGFEEGYNKTYDELKNGIKDEESKTNEYGRNFGKLMGEIFGYKDYYEGKSNKWKNAIPSDSEILNIFNLKNETAGHRQLFINSFKEWFQEGYEEGYRKANFEPIKVSYVKGKEDGAYFGGTLGSIFGKKDFYENKVSNWEINLPSDEKIVKDFSLSSISKEYLEGFLAEFKRAFEKKYNEVYRLLNTEIFTLYYENGYQHGKEIGTSRGISYANIDLLLGLTNDSLRYKQSDYEIISEFKLYLENEKYREGFISGYNEGFIKGYTITYQNGNADKSLQKLVIDKIPTSGGRITSKDNRVTLSIEKGTYYNDIIVLLNKFNDLYGAYLLNQNWIKASDIFTVKVVNPSYQFDNSKKIELSFEYYGPKTGGVYKYSNGIWTYLPSKITEDRITTYIRPSSLNTDYGIYAVFIDESFINIRDIRGHWAKDEINTYVRRGLAQLFPDKTFRPDSPITRGQLLRLLSKVYNWNLKGLDDKIKELENLKDYNDLGDYKQYVAYGLKQGYIGVFSDNTFKVNYPVTYNQINYVMRKVTGDNNFNWTKIASSMQQYKDTRSKSYNSMDNTITRAEVIYMLYLLNE